MEGAQVFTCNTNSGFMGRLSKSTENLYLRVENDKVSGRGYICNAEGKNGYIDDFSFMVSEIGSVSISDYIGSQALVFSAHVSNLYGAKKAQIALPQLKNMDLVLGLLNRLKKNSDVQGDDWQTTSSSKAPAAAAPTPVPVQTPVREEAAPTQFSGKTEKTVEPVKKEEASSGKKLSAEEFQKRMEKLTVLKDCGLLGEKEFNTKKIELVSEFCDLTEFNQKVQKMVALKDCGLLSEKEFEANRNVIIKECCNVDTADMDEYRRNIQKLSFLELGGVITSDECMKNKMMLVEDVAFSLNDSKESFDRKLKKLPILKESQLITEDEYQEKVEHMFSLIDVTGEEDYDILVDKLNKWPLLAEEKYISAMELKTKQKDLIAKCINTDWQNLDQLRNVVTKMAALRQGEWMSEMEFYGQKEDLLKKIDSMQNYPKKLQARMMLPTVGFVSEKEDAAWRQRCINEIFSPCADMEEFKNKANNLMELEKYGVITETQFVEYKAKLMSDL